MQVVLWVTVVVLLLLSYRADAHRRRYRHGHGGQGHGGNEHGGYGYPRTRPPMPQPPRPPVTTPGPPDQKTIVTVAGNGVKGTSAPGTLATSASLNNPNGVAVDQQGNVYIADAPTHTITYISAADGKLYIFAGTAGKSGYTGDGGHATAALLNTPRSVAVDVDADGQTVIYIADSLNHKVRKVSVATGIITTFAGPPGPGQSGAGQAQVGDGGLATASVVRLANPRFIACDSTGVYWSDVDGFRIRKVTKATGIISTVAGTGQTGLAALGQPANQQKIGSSRGVAVSPQDGAIFFSDTLYHRVLKIGQSNNLELVAGTGVAGYDASIVKANETRLNSPYGLAFDLAGVLYIADVGNNMIRAVNKTTRAMSTFAGVQDKYGYNGDDLPPTFAYLYNAQAIAVGPSSRCDSGVPPPCVRKTTVFLADSSNFRIRMINGTAA